MPAARAIRYKSGLAPANTLRSASWRILSLLLFPAQQPHTLCRPHFPPTFKACPKSVAASAYGGLRQTGPDACLCRNGYVQAGQSYLTPMRHRGRRHAMPLYNSFLANGTRIWTGRFFSASVVLPN